MLALLVLAFEKLFTVCTGAQLAEGLSEPGSSSHPGSLQSTETLVFDRGLNAWAFELRGGGPKDTRLSGPALGVGPPLTPKWSLASHIWVWWGSPHFLHLRVEGHSKCLWFGRRQFLQRFLSLTISNFLLVSTLAGSVHMP